MACQSKGMARAAPNATSGADGLGLRKFRWAPRHIIDFKFHFRIFHKGRAKARLLAFRLFNRHVAKNSGH
jgi:hypothetical protein